jgi:hypothetical protein
MNQKIKELAEHARAEVRAEWYRENEIQYPNGHYVFQITVDQKFAELIIKECARVCVQENPDPRDSIELQCTNRILKRFGI